MPPPTRAGATTQAGNAPDLKVASLNHAPGAELGRERPVPSRTRTALGANHGLTLRTLVVDMRDYDVAPRSGE